MIMDNGNLFLADTALEQGMKAINIIKEKFDGVIIVGVEFECSDNEVGRIDSIKMMTPIVCCLLNGVSGMHHYRVDITDKLIELKRN